MEAHRIAEDMARLEQLEQERLLLDAGFEGLDVRQRVLDEATVRLEDERAEAEGLRRELELQLELLQRQHGALQERTALLAHRREEHEHEREELDETLRQLIRQRDRIDGEFTSLYARLERAAEENEGASNHDAASAGSAPVPSSLPAGSAPVVPSSLPAGSAPVLSSLPEEASHAAPAPATFVIPPPPVVNVFDLEERTGEPTATSTPSWTSNELAKPDPEPRETPVDASLWGADEVTAKVPPPTSSPWAKVEAPSVDLPASSSARWVAPVVRGDADVSSKGSPIVQDSLADAWFDEASVDVDPTPSFAWKTSPPRATSLEDRLLSKPRATAASGSIYIRESEPSVPDDRDEPPLRRPRARTIAAWVALAACIPAAVWLGAALSSPEDPHAPAANVTGGPATQAAEPPVVIVMPVLGPPIVVTEDEAERPKGSGLKADAKGKKPRRAKKPAAPKHGEPVRAAALGAPGPRKAATKRSEPAPTRPHR